MARVRTTIITMAWLVALVSLDAGAPAAANPFLIEASPYKTTATFALRYWSGIGSTSKDLYNLSGSLLVSRLTYDGWRTHAAEGVFRIDLENSLFLKAMSAAACSPRVA